MSRQTYIRSLLLLITAIGIGFLIHNLLPLKYPYSNDTGGYVQEAQSLLDGHGFERGTQWDNVDVAHAPFPLFPPGYPVLIATVAGGLALDFPEAALAVSWGAWLLLLPALYLALRPFIGGTAAVAVAALVATSPGLVEWAYLALSDSAMLVLSVITLGLLLREPQRATWRLLFVSGLVAGCAYWVRNAAVVLPVTVLGYFIAAVVLRQIDLKSAFRSFFIWGVGFACLAVPLFAYNVWVFGSLQPYLSAHGGTDFGLVNAFRLSLWSLLLDVTGWRAIAELAWDAKAAALTLLPALLVLAWLARLRWRQANSDARLQVLLLAIYLAIGFTIIVWGRSRFDWVEVTLTRQLMPYSWALLALLVWTVGQRWLLMLTAVGLMLGRAQAIGTELRYEQEVREAVASAPDLATAAARLPGKILTHRIKHMLAAHTELKALIAQLPVDTHLISNFGPILTVETGRHIRRFDPTPANLAALPELARRLGPHPLVLIVVPNNANLRAPDAANWQTRLVASLPPHTVLLRSPDVLVVRVP